MKNIVLVGFMGTGKSVVGRNLAKAMNLCHLDTDAEIEMQVGQSVAEIFSRDGEAYFRTLEAQMVDRVACLSAYVISTGGGMPLCHMERLREIGLCIALMALPETVIQRTRKRPKARPLLEGGDAPATIRRLMAEREPYYRRAHILLETGDQAVGEIVRRIQEEVSAFEAETYSR